MSRFLPAIFILLNLLVARSELLLTCSNCLKQGSVRDSPGVVNDAEPTEAIEQPTTTTTTTFASTTSTTPITTSTTSTTRRTTRTVSSVVESCSSYYTVTDQPRSAINCTQQSPFCCGDCNDRYCCSELKYRFNGSKCTETCVSFYTSNSELVKVQKCSLGQYCCGSCTQRQCCSDVTARLDQTQCVLGDVTSSKSQESYWWLFGLTGVFFIIFIILMLVGNYKKISLNRTRNLFITQTSQDDTQAMTSSRRNLIRVLTMRNNTTAHSRNNSQASLPADGPTPRNSLRSSLDPSYNSIYLSSMNNYQYPPSLPDYSNIDPRHVTSNRYPHHLDDLPPAYSDVKEANKMKEAVVIGVKEESTL